MTIGIIFPSFLRTGLDKRVRTDPAEVDALNLEASSISNVDFPPSMQLQKSSSSLSWKVASHPKRHRRSVSFDNQVLVVEVERVPKSDSMEVWWSCGEMVRFRSEASKSKESRRRGIKRSARTTNHARTVLVQQSASEELDGIPTDPKTLSMIASISSRKARESAYKSAQQLEKEVKEEVYSHERSNSIVSELAPSRHVRKEKRTVSDFYWGAVVDAFTDTVTCGISSKVIC